VQEVYLPGLARTLHELWLKCRKSGRRDLRGRCTSCGSSAGGLVAGTCADAARAVAQVQAVWSPGLTQTLHELWLKCRRLVTGTILGGRARGGPKCGRRCTRLWLECRRSCPHTGCSCWEAEEADGLIRGSWSSFTPVKGLQSSPLRMTLPCRKVFLGLSGPWRTKVAGMP
jgi:hypothetical protein